MAAWNPPGRATKAVVPAGTSTVTENRRPSLAQPSRWWDCGTPRRRSAVHVLEDGSIELRPGELHGLVVENGAGKSTLGHRDDRCAGRRA
jgi:ABC-type polysaccharide/polyol phosphate transport system ATPase subunit